MNTQTINSILKNHEILDVPLGTSLHKLRQARNQIILKLNKPLTQNINDWEKIDTKTHKIQKAYLALSKL